MQEDYEDIMETDSTIEMEEPSAPYEVDASTGNIEAFVRDRFTKAEASRYTDEQRWSRAYNNYRGVYGDDVKFTSTEKSRVFVKVTKTKVLGAYGQVSDTMISSDKFPISINPSILPDGVKESVHFDTDPAAEQIPSTEAKPPVEGDERKLKPGELFDDWMRRVGPLANKLKPVENKIKDGPGTTPSQITFSPAMVAAKKMEKMIHDQLDETNARKHLRTVAFECVLFGTGILKGPFAENKEYPSWNKEGEYEPFEKLVPKTSSVSIWNFFPDPDATNMDDAEWVIERHKMSRAKLRALKRRPFFRPKAIDKAISFGESYTKEWYEQLMEDDAQRSAADRFEVLEFWGNVEVELLEEHNVKIPAKLKKSGQVSANIWICNGQVLRMALNPFNPVRIPYHAVPYEVNPYSFFGIGLAENMEDSQLLMNGFMRMAVDNAALSGNLILEVDENNLTPGQDLTLHPGKVFRRQGGAPGQAIFGTKFPNVSNENLQLFDKARSIADESTGFPSFAHGQTGVSGVGRTASGISMLMSAANGSIRTVIKNFDDYLLGPLGKAFFHFNMQFNFDEDVVGDLEVKAMGIESLMANEVRSQRLMQFLGVVQNPVLAPFAKMDYLVREIARSMDLDPDKAVNSMSDAALQAEILKQFQQPLEQPPEGVEGPPGGVGSPEGPTGAPAGPPAGAQAQDTQGSGGGQVGTGSVPAPNTPGFSANTGGMQ